MQQLLDAIAGLESRQLELLAIMTSSDAHAAKCAKLGLSFGAVYPDELAEYQAAREEFNENEATIASLKEELASAEAETMIQQP